MNRKTTGEIIFDVLNTVLMLLITAVMLYPMLNQLAVSLSSNNAISSGQVNLIPKNFTVQAYKDILVDKNFTRSFLNTVGYTLIGTLLHVAMTMIMAYPLSKKNLKGRNIVMRIMIISMLIGTGGMIPNYLLVKKLHLLNSYAALIIPGMVNCWNIIVVKNFYQQLPAEMEEAAFIDGAGIGYTFIHIVLPLSTPVLATMALFNAVGAWNTFLGAIIYITNPNKKLLQVYLNNVLQNVQTNSNAYTGSTGADVISSDSMKAAVLMCSVLPIIAVYPFLQKYFASGLMIGSIKG